MVMGKQKGIRLKGTFNGIIYYQSREQDLVRSVPKHVEQTTATIAQAEIFGRAAHLGSMLRQLLAPVLPADAHGKARLRFDDALRKWLRSGLPGSDEPQDNLPFLCNYEFNTEGGLYERLKTKITVSRNSDKGVIVHLPALTPVTDITAPAGTTAVTLKVMVATCPVTGGASMANDEQELLLSYDDAFVPAQDWSLNVASGRGSVTLTAVGLRYHTSKRNPTMKMADPRWTPVGIVAAMYN